MIPGEVIPGREPVEINAGLPVTSVDITNTGEVPVHVTAHFHVFEANPRLSFDRRKAWGMRLDVPSNGAVRFEPGQTARVDLVPIGGARVVYGFNSAVNGPLDQADADEALRSLIERGFLHVEPDDTAAVAPPPGTGSS
jgi:urease beta subunit